MLKTEIVEYLKRFPTRYQITLNDMAEMFEQAAYDTGAAHIGGALLVDGKAVEAQYFAFDGCHKIYLIDSVSAEKEMEGYGYSSRDTFPISKLPWAWEKSCFLRFISWADLRQPDLVPQDRDKDPVIEWVTK